MVGLDVLHEESNAHQPHYLKTCHKPNLDLGNTVYLFGYTEKQELAVSEGNVVIATDNLIKLLTDGVNRSLGSAGFDVHGNLAFMICDPMKLATSSIPRASSTSSSTSSWKKDLSMQFGIPIPVICDWLNQHWEGNLDEFNKPKLPLMRLMSTGQRSDHSCASFTMRRVFKSNEGENEGSTTSKLVGQYESNSAAVDTQENDILAVDLQGSTHVQGIQTPDIYECPTLTSVPIKKDVSQIQLLDINFPPRFAKAALSPRPARKLLVNCEKKISNDLSRRSKEGHHFQDIRPSSPGADAESTGSVNGALDGVQSSSSPIQISEVPNGYSSEGDTTVYSAETAESRNYTSPRVGMLYQLGRSQSCVNHNRWGSMQKIPVARGTLMEKHRKYVQGRKMHSQGATSQRSNDYFSPTVSSIMKKRNNLEQQNRPGQSAFHSTPRWLF